MGEMLDSTQQAKGQLEYWRDHLSNWIAWLDSEIADITSGHPPNKTSFLLLQHISLLKPWFRGLMNILPVRTPENVAVTQCEYQEPRFITWPQRITRRSHHDLEKSESA